MKMQILTRCFTAVAAVVWFGAGAASAAPPPGDVPRYSVDGAAGSAVGHTGDGVVAAGATVNIVPRLQVRGEFGRMTNVMPESTTNALNDLSASLGDPTQVTFDAKTPATYGTATARVFSRPFGRVTPFASGGGGMAHLTTDVSAIASGVDVTSAFDAAAGSIAPVTKPLFVAGGGVSLATSRRSAVEVEYRYDRIFTDTAIATNRIMASMRVAF